MTDIYYTARHLLQAFQALDDARLDAPLILIHGKGLEKPNLIRGFLPALTPCDRNTVEAKKPSLLTLAQF